MDETYEGFSNWDTWMVCFQADNDFPLYRQLSKFSAKFDSMTADVAKKLAKRFWPKQFPIPEMNYNKVNWQEVASHWAMTDR